MSVLIVIPARMKATRLPNKPLALIAGEPMIVQVWRRACEANLGRVVVACDGEEIASAVRAAGGEAVITDPELPSGSDRVWQVVSGQWPVASDQSTVSNKKSSLVTGDWPLATEDIIINLQGDVPTLEPRLLQELLEPLKNPEVHIATLVAEITRAEEHENPSVVKAVVAFPPPPLGGRLGGGRRVGSVANSVSMEQVMPPPQPSPYGGGSQTGRALYFTRATAPYGEGARYHHIGVYAYRRAALERFVALPPSPLELREKLEQLRALEAGFRIDVRVVDTVPLGVDTPEDLERARAFIQNGGKQ